VACDRALERREYLGVVPAVAHLSGGGRTAGRFSAEFHLLKCLRTVADVGKCERELVAYLTSIAAPAALHQEYGLVVR
jgi:hypothetical protein